MKTYKPKIQIALLIGLCVLDLGGTAYLVQWREQFWQAVNDRHLGSFLELLAIFSGVAITLCVINGLEQYIQNKLALNWRRMLTRKAIKSLKELKLVEGHQQRIQEDCLNYPLLFISLLQYVVMQSVLVLYFIWVIYHHMGALYVLIPLLYGALGTTLSYYIAYPLIALNYINQVLEAKFRQTLEKLDYGKVHRNNHRMFIKTKHLNYFQYFYSQISIIFPYLLLSPAYFSGKIAFGVFMQIASTIGSLTDALGSIVTNFDKINKMLSCRKRLKELHII